jgi:hypothetical protein
MNKEINMDKIHAVINSFVRRQTPESDFSHFDGTWDELVLRVSEAYIVVRQGYRDGVILVRVNPDRFYTSVVELKEGDQLVGEYIPRREGEEPRQSVRVLRKARKQLAKFVEIVLYRHDVLMEKNENDTDAEWEIISINAYPTDCEAPIELMTLMHNHFDSSGGTATKMSNDKFVAALEESFKYWKNKGFVKNVT